MRAKLIADGVLGHDAYVVIAGPANTYAHYVITLTMVVHSDGNSMPCCRLPQEKSTRYNDMKEAPRSSDNVSPFAP